MKHSLVKQIAFVFIGLTLITLLCCIGINTAFLEKYYLHIKQDSLLHVYDAFQKYMSGGMSSEDENARIEVEKLCGKYNINLLVVDSDLKTVAGTMRDTEIFKRRLMERIFNSERWNSGDRVLMVTDQYILCDLFDPRMNTGYLEMWGYIAGNNFFIMRTPKEGIRESVNIANKFLAYVAITSVFASGIIIWFTTKKITGPLLELTAISKKMSALDFNTKYTGHSHNEIGELGNNINVLSETLEKTISELKSANNELKKDVEKKQQIDDIRKEFLSNVSHELKTPIALIQGYAEGLRDGMCEDAESREYYCDVIVDEASKMNEMVKKLLTLNQLEFGNEAVHYEHFDIMEMIRSFVQSAEILSTQSGVRVTVDGPNREYVWADEFMTEEVIRNYFSNALNHCSGDRVIQIKCKKNGDKVRISVFNTGEAIPEESLEHIWEKFYKVDKARTRKYGGSGIGLSIVRAIANAFNEQCGVINYDNGVEFWIELSANSLESVMSL